MAVLIRSRLELDDKGVAIDNILSVIPGGMFFFQLKACQGRLDENILVDSNEDTSIYSPSIIDLNSALELSTAISALKAHFISVLECVKNLRCGRVFRNLLHRTRCLSDLVLEAKDSESSQS